LIISAGLAASLLGTAPALAQSMSANSSSYNGGYGRSSGSENHAIDLPSARGADGNRTIIDGIIQTGASTVSARAAAYASANLSGGVGSGSSVSSGSSTAVGNSLTVITQGNYNTVIVDSTQINNGNITANVGANVSGGVGQ
jgi:holdfast attachment protein HfaA